MRITKTPFRISFFGGGTDYPEWIEKNDSKIISTTIDKYCYLTCRELPPFFKHKYRIAYSKIEDVQSIEEIENRAIKAVLRDSGIDYGLEIHCDADLPARSGIGSSSSFVVALLNCLDSLKGNHITKSELAKKAIYIEQKVLKETVGAQDQIAAAFGGFNILNLRKGNEFSIEKVNISTQRIKNLNDHLMLFFTGFSRISSKIAKSQVMNMDSKINELKMISEFAERSLEILYSGADIDLFGELLHESWLIKSKLSVQVTNNTIDQIYNRGLKSGALGGKLLGAGGGGFMLLFVRPEDQKNVKLELSDLLHIPFKFESQGSQVIYSE